MNIKTYTFDANGITEQSKEPKGVNWPVVYMLYNSNTLYIGETTSADARMKQHFSNPNKQKAHLTNMKIIYDDTFNKSVILDYEQKMIKYCKADKKFAKVLNANNGQLNAHDYYQKAAYTSYFHTIWNGLQKEGMVSHKLDILENANIFKYSPYTSLTPEQEKVEIDILNDIYDVLNNNKKGISLVNGCAGTGKTVLAISIIYSLVNAINIDLSELNVEQKEDPLNQARLKIKWFSEHVRPIKVGFVFPMTGIRSVIEKVFKECGDGLTANMIISPYKLKDNDYDVLFVDESHRLSRRKNLGTLFGQFDNVCNSFGLDPNKASQLDWVLKQSKYTILFYDKDQSIKSTDITYIDYQNTLKPYQSVIKEYTLYTQMRCAGGNAFIDYLKDIVNCICTGFKPITNYDFKIFRDVDVMINKIRELDYSNFNNGNDNNLCKVVAGYSWDWSTKPDKSNIPNDMNKYNEIVSSGKYDIDIKGNHYIWNLTTENWISRHDSHYTIGCIHTTQGFDLRYVGVIFGEEIDYNPVTHKIEIDLDKFKDRNVKAGCDEKTVKEYIINTYTTIMARGINGCYVYACNKNLQDYLENYIQRGNE